MKFREAVEQAHRELGATEEAIARGSRAADLQFLGNLQPIQTEITPGFERACIDHIKQFYRYVASMPPGQLEKLRQAIMAKTEDHHRNQ